MSKLRSPLIFTSIDSEVKRCGCYVRHPDLLENVKPKTHVAIPLKHIDYDIEVTNGLVSTTLQQKYFNPTLKYLEIDFSFPINPKACIYKFVAEFGNKRIEGIVKEKEQAKAEYKEAVQQGKQAVYAEIDQNSKDIMNMEIGNLGPGEELKVSISYLQQLNVEQNTFYQLHIPSTISPRYMNEQKGRRWVENVQSVQGEYTWTFKITLLTSKKLAYYVSHSHNLQLISENAEKTETILCLAKEEKPNVDLSLLFTVEDFHLPSYVLGRTDVSCTAMLSFIPKFCELSLDDAMKASMAKKQLETDMSAAKGEYIFLLDRSGSMGGKRIEKAKEALILFLQSLPEDTYFNVVSFGDGSNFMFNQSIKYQKESLDDAVKKIGTMRADMGGTEIYNPLSKILQTKVIDGYPKQIFLLTDGGVSNTEGVIQLVGRQVKYSRCHSIGIGNGCSEALIKGCAEKGKGKFIFITDQENPSEKIIGLLEETLTPVIDHVTLKYDKDLVESIVPNPESLPYILKNEVVNFYITFKGQLEKSTEFTFGYKDSMNKLPFETKMEIDPESQNMPFVDKMAHNKIIKNLEVSAKENKPIEEFMFYVKVVDKKKEAINHSVKHQILSEHTAFICVNQELIDGKYQQIKDTGSQKVKIQHIQQEEQSEQYNDQSSSSNKSNPYGVRFLCSTSMTRGQNTRIKMIRRGLRFDDAEQECYVYQSSHHRQTNFQKDMDSLMFGSSLTRPRKTIISQQNRPEKAIISQQETQKPMSKGGLRINSDSQDDPIKLPIQQLKEDQPKVDLEQTSKTKFKRTNQPKRPVFQSKANQPVQPMKIEDLIKQQNVEGSFVSKELLKQLYHKDFKMILAEGEAKNIMVAVIISYVVAKWIETHHPEKRYCLIIKKAYSFIKKTHKLSELQFLDVLLHKKEEVIG